MREHKTNLYSYSDRRSIGGGIRIRQSIVEAFAVTVAIRQESVGGIHQCVAEIGGGVRSRRPVTRAWQV